MVRGRDALHLSRSCLTFSTGQSCSQRRVRSTRALTDERAARRTLLDQVARLEDELSQVFCSTWPRTDIRSRSWPAAAAGRACSRSPSSRSCATSSPARVADARRALSDRTWVEEQNRRLIEEMLLEPERHKWVRVSTEDIGEPGCRHWHVRPRWGFIGMLLGWWRVVITSGCPLAT